MTILKSICFLVTLLFVSSNSFAVPCNCGDLNCCTEKFTLDSIIYTPELGVSPNDNLLSSSYFATSCEGVFLGENDDAGGLSSPSPNIGMENDGILNGQGDLFTGLEFIESGDLQDLDGNGIFTDPGWIHLAELDTQDGSVTYDTSGPNPYGANLVLNIEELLTLTFEDTNSTDDGLNEGKWTLTTHLDVIAEAQSLLGEATFDHLAFSIKAGDAFAVYDFDFKEIFTEESNPALNFLTPYELSGTFNTNDFLSCKKVDGECVWTEPAHAISHLNVWARDPADTTVIPEPATLFLLGVGFVGIGFYTRRRR